MRTLVLAALAGRLVVDPDGSRSVASRVRHARRQRQQPSPTPTGARPARQYLRVAPANYADGITQPGRRPVDALRQQPHLQRRAQNLFSENGVTQWGFGGASSWTTRSACARRPAARARRSRSTPSDPLEEFRNDFGAIEFTRTPAAPGHGRRPTPRQQINTVGSYIDALERLRRHDERLEWLREGPVDGDMSNNGAKLLLPRRLPAAARRPRQRRDGARRWRSTGRLTGDARPKAWSPATCGPTRTSRSRRPTRCSRASTTGSSTRCRASCSTRSRSSRSPGASSAPSSSSSPTTSSCPRSACGSPPYRGYNPNVERDARRTSSPSSATGRTA